MPTTDKKEANRGTHPQRSWKGTTDATSGGGPSDALPFPLETGEAVAIGIGCGRGYSTKGVDAEKFKTSTQHAILYLQLAGSECRIMVEEIALLQEELDRCKVETYKFL